MIKVTFVQPDGAEQIVEVDEGTSAMHGAVRANIPGIEAECGGALACATCHVYVEDVWLDKLPKVSPMEEDMLDFVHDLRPNSRLSCQIRLIASLNGLKLHVPASQG